MATKKIEDLEQTTNLSDPDLMFISKSNGNGYDSKKVTLASIAEYVRNSIDSGGSGSSSDENPSCSCGYKIYDISSDNSNSDYIFKEEIPFVAAGSANYPKSWSHDFTHDCEIFLGINYGATHSPTTELN